MVKIERQWSPADFDDNPIGAASKPHDEVSIGECPGGLYECKEDACEGDITLLPCPFCGGAVEIRWNEITGEHFIAHVDYAINHCEQRAFYGNAALWNDRVVENRLRAELDACRAVHRSKNQQIEMLIRQVREYAVIADRAVEAARGSEKLRAEVGKWMRANNAATDLIIEQQAEIEGLKARISKLLHDKE